MKLSQSKENSNAPPLGGRKTSTSNMNSGRPGARRRETSDSFTANGPLSPTDSKAFFRNDPNTSTPPVALLRRRTDFKDEDSGQNEEGAKNNEEADAQTPFASLRRSGTGPLSAGLNGPSSPWSAGPQSSAFGPMGTFGSFAVGSPVGPEANEKRPGFGSARGGSRFKDLLSKQSNEDMSSSVKEKTPFAGLGKLPEEDPDAGQSRLRDIFRTRPTRSETNPYDDGPARTGSAALSGSQDDVDQVNDQMGFSAFGSGMQGHLQAGHPFNQSPQARQHAVDPFSPSNTNPYQSPIGNPKDEDEHEGMDATSQPSALPPFGSIRRNMLPRGEDQSQPAFLGGPRSGSGLGGLGGLPPLVGAQAWGSAGFQSSTPARERGAVSTAFGDSIFGPMAEMQSPGVGAGLGSAALFGGPGFGNAAGRSSRLGGLFPPAMQDSMRADSRNEGLTNSFEARADNMVGGRDAFDNFGRRRDDAFPRGGGVFDDALRAGDSFDSQAPSNNVGQNQTSLPGNVGQQGASAGPDAGPSAQEDNSPSGGMPTSQQRQMVMPDRMRWIYRDPSGNTQGPWSGLEMHDWFKAGFFTAELQVKKLEDTEYEPLAQLVRRIGNSREPFLVPQIGVPHGAPTVNQGNHWASPTMSGAPPAQGSAQPPFANNFPSFGTTLTAEQQNALERRKQEEQYLMARQKEHLAAQQVLMRNTHMPNGPHTFPSLQHQASAQSLHSQPSMGSIASPSAFQPPPMPNPIQPPQPFAENTARHAFGTTSQQPFNGVGRGNREDNLPHLMENMGFGQRSGLPFGAGPLGGAGRDSEQFGQNVSSMLQDRSRLQQEQQMADGRVHSDAFLGNDRLEEFHQLRGQADIEPARQDSEQLAQPIGAPAQRNNLEAAIKQPAPIGHPGAISRPVPITTEPEILSLAQQVQRTAAAAKQAASFAQEAPPQPPPVSISPLPAPAAQRNRLHVADALAAESRSATQTPVETSSTSLAPWADKTAEVSRGPSLREIQEAEARRAAEQEELAAAARRAQAEQERLSQAQAPMPAPGLPSTSTWASSASPATPTIPGASAWSRAQATTPGTAPIPATKKTLAQIQKEEENRKQRALAQANAVAAATLPTAAGGKRYAELASKVAPATPAAGGVWMTVGSSGKTKAPVAVVAAPPTARAVSSTAAPAAKLRPAMQTRSTSVANTDKAKEELTKWAKGALGKGLKSNVNCKCTRAR